MTIHRAVTLALTLIALITWVVWLIKFPRKWGYAVGVILWLLNMMVFTVAVVIAIESGPINTELFNYWSTVIRWQAILYAIGAACCVILDRRKKQQAVKNE